jgi:hypothetical protein
MCSYEYFAISIIDVKRPIKEDQIQARGIRPARLRTQMTSRRKADEYDELGEKVGLEFTLLTTMSLQIFADEPFR